MKLHRKTKKPRLRLNKRNLGRSIEERPKEAEERKEFGHWECDLIIGAKFGQDEALLTLLECKTREFMIVKLPNKSAKSVKSVMTAFETLMDKCGEYFGAVFKTITTDNGSEFAALSSFEKAAETLVYSVHSYTSCDYDHKVNFVSKEAAIKNTDIIINVMNLTRIPDSKLYNVGYFSEEYLRQATKPLIFINVTRGDIAPEHVLLKLYKEGKITGIGVDVFTDETEFSEALNGRGEFNTDDLRAGKEILDKAIDRSENFYVQPHQGFNSDKAAVEKAKDAIAHVCAWYKNKGTKFDEQLPYYKL